MRAHLSPDIDPKVCDAMPGAIDRLLQHVEALGGADYDYDGLPITADDRPILPPLNSDYDIIIAILRAADEVGRIDDLELELEDTIRRLQAGEGYLPGWIS